MSPGRNDPCPCGSGKKYKKCCQQKNEAAAREQAAAAMRAAEEKRQAQREQEAREWEERRALEPLSTPEFDEDSAESGRPPLSEADQRLVDAWWEAVGPVYEGDAWREKCGWALERVLAFLDQQPRLFRYLNLHDEFLFELAGALARAGRMGDHLALLRRLRTEQPEMYFQSFGYYDLDLLAEAFRTGRREEIPACLALFRQHPVEHIDCFADAVDLLAWRGCEQELRQLLEPTAETIANSPKVLGGNFGLLWLTNLAVFPFLEAGDDSPEALAELCRAAFSAGFLDEGKENHEWLRRAVIMASRPAPVANLDLGDAGNEWLQNDAGWNFTGWAHRTKGLPWSSARFLAVALLGYWGWQERKEKKKKKSPFGLDETRLDHYLAQSCRDIISIKGLRAVPLLQAFHYFTEYLVAHDYFGTTESVRLQSAAADLYETVRNAVVTGDPAYCVCPTYEALLPCPNWS